LEYFPRGYKDKSEITKIRDIRPDESYTVRVRSAGKPRRAEPGAGLLLQS
jgi:hypothetical protein